MLLATNRMGVVGIPGQSGLEECGASNPRTIAGIRGSISTVWAISGSTVQSASRQGGWLHFHRHDDHAVSHVDRFRTMGTTETPPFRIGLLQGLVPAACNTPNFDPAKSTREYPLELHTTTTLPIQVFRDGTTIEIVNSTDNTTGG